MKHRNGRGSLMLLSLALIGLVAGTTGCMEDLGVVDRTQPNKIPKSMFRGVWYNVQTVVEVPSSTAFTFEGDTYAGYFEGDSNTIKIVWDIQEDYLIAYPVAELVHDSEKDFKTRYIRNYWEKDDDGKIADKFFEIYTGQPVAAFQIESHFDVKRQYNPATGAESNVLEENTSDRKWWEREYVRVDWARNEISRFLFLEGIESQGVDYYVQDYDGNDPDAPVLTDDLIMITTKLFAQPMSQYDCEPIQGTAWAAETDCAGAVVKVRNAFRKVDPNNDYVPQRYSNMEHADKFGFFLTERYDYDEDYGVTAYGKVSLINRWNLWDQSRTVVYEFDGKDERPLVSCYNNEDCAAYAPADGEPQPNHCWIDEWFAEGHCVRWEIMPVKDRPTRPIIYHFSGSWPELYYQEIYELADGYSDIFADAVAWSKYWDERGMLHPKSCTTNADCATADLLLDIEFEDSIQSAGEPVICSATLPCKIGQICHADGYCYENEGGQPGAQILTYTMTPQDHTFVVYDNAGTTEYIDILGEYTSSNIGSDEAIVRFVNASPGSTAQLFVGATSIGNAVTFQASPTEFQSGVVTPAMATVRVQSGGADVAERQYVDIEGGHSYIIVFAGGDKIAVADYTTLSRTPNEGGGGIRVINALVGEAVDVALNAAAQATNLEFRGATEYMAPRPHKQRLTVVRSGGDSNVTCYAYEGNGQCIGWKPTLTDADRAHAAELKAAAGPMFVACTNIYTGEGAENCDPDGDGTMNYGDQSLMNDCRYSVVNEDGSVSNPCKDRVPEYDQPKLHGDIRYSFFYWCTGDAMASPLGYGPSAGDPDTGEIFYGIAHVYGWPMETYGTYARDLLWLVNGMDDDGNPFGEQDMITGEYIRDYVSHHTRDSEYESLTAALRTDVAVDEDFRHIIARADQLPKALKHVFERDKPARYFVPDTTITPEAQEMMISLDAQIQRALAGARAHGVDVGRARMERIRGTYIEDLMVTEEVKLAFAGDSQPDGDLTAMTDADRAAASPVNWLSGKALAAERRRMEYLESHNIMMPDFHDESLWHLAKKLGCDDPTETPTTDIYDPDLGNGKCLQGDYLRWSVTGRMLGGTIEHEVGHTVGLRHNFVASADVFNFQDEYFGIREKETVLCLDSDWCTPGERCEVTRECTSDADCGQGAFCDAGTNRCTDRDGMVYGLCMRTETVRTTCDSDAACGGGICEAGVCQTRLTCSAGEACREGDVCEGGTCIDENGDAALVPMETSQEVLVRKFLPRAYPTEAETKANRMEYQYSSLMDYGGGINFDLRGLGKYDRAALLFGYGELVETYRDISSFDETIETWADEYGMSPERFGFLKDTEYWRYSGAYRSSFYYLNDIVSVSANLKRDPSPYRTVRAERQMVQKDSLRDAMFLTWVQVPYKYTSDEYRQSGVQGGCYYFDLGADFSEIVYHSLIKLREYYVFDAFKRESYAKNGDGNPMAYYARIMDRWMTPLKDAGMYWALYYNILKRYSWFGSWRSGAVDGWGLYSSSKMAMQAFTELISSPAPGTYRLNAAKNEWELVDYAAKEDLAADEAVVPFGVGKFPYTTFANVDGFVDAGYWRYDHALWIGSFWEKSAALYMLTESFANFLSEYLGEALNVGIGSSVGFTTSYPYAIANFLGGIIAGEPTLWEGYMDPATGVYESRYALSPDSADVDLPVVPSSIRGLSLQLYAAVLGLSYLPRTFDPTFIDSLAVVVKGNGSEYEITDDVDVAEFTDPFSHKTYMAHTINYGYDDPDTPLGSTGAGESRIQPIAAAYRLIENANALKARYEDATALVETLEAAADADPAELAAARVEAADLAGQIREKCKMLDILRTLNELYGRIVY